MKHTWAQAHPDKRNEYVQAGDRLETKLTSAAADDMQTKTDFQFVHSAGVFHPRLVESLWNDGFRCTTYYSSVFFINVRM